MSNQKDAVFATVQKFLGSEFKTPVKLTDEQHKAVTLKLAEGFVAKTIKHRNPHKVETMETAGIYAKGLLSNWLRRDERLAGIPTAPAAPAAEAPAAE